MITLVYLQNLEKPKTLLKFNENIKICQIFLKLVDLKLY